MKNSEFKIGSHIMVQGYKGVVEEIYTYKEYKVDFEGKILGNGLELVDDDNAENMKAKGYNLVPTGRTGTYFKVSFKDEENIKDTVYDNGTYGCIDDFEEFGTW